MAALIEGVFDKHDLKRILLSVKVEKLKFLVRIIKFKKEFCKRRIFVLIVEIRYRK